MRLSKKLALSLAAMMAAATPALAADGVEVDPLGPSNVLIRVDGSQRYLMIPVEESQNDSRIDVLTNCNIAETFYVRLAKDKVDFYVPFDLDRFKGKDIVFNVMLNQPREWGKNPEENVFRDKLSLSDTLDVSNKEKFRPAYHHSPLWGWMNDPNGMFYKDGVWNLYYQHNPYGSKWQNMTWGHATSTDLINWHFVSEAIRPNGLGSVFSGSCVIDHNNTAGFGKDAVVALYTSAAASQIQSLAYSNNDGTDFTIYDANPVITLDSEARDPNIFWYPATGEWVLLLAHALDHEMLIYTSKDLKNWNLQSSFGKGLGCQAGVWECPDLMEIEVEDTGEKKWILICNINPGGPFGGSAAQYFIGDFDGHKFTADLDKNGNVPTKWLDYGKDNYAVVSWSGAPDGRHTTIGWMSNWEYADRVPTVQYRSSNTVPREIKLFRGSDGEIYAQSEPVAELLAMRDKAVVAKGKVNVGAKPSKFNLPVANGGICEILVTLDANSGSKESLKLVNAKGENCVITFDPAAKTLSFDRRESGIVDFSEHFPAVTTTSTFSDSDKIGLRIFVDHSSIEVFGDNGRCVMTNIVFPNEPYSRLEISAEGGNAKAENLKIYSLKVSNLE